MVEVVCCEGLSITRVNREGKQGSAHARRDYSILRRGRAKGSVFQLLETGTDFRHVHLAWDGGVWAVAGTAQCLIPWLLRAHRRLA